MVRNGRRERGGRGWGWDSTIFGENLIGACMREEGGGGEGGEGEGVTASPAALYHFKIVPNCMSATGGGGGDGGGVVVMDGSGGGGGDRSNC